MRVSNKKLVVVILLLIEFGCCYLMYQSSKKNINLAKVSYEENINNSMFAMYVENEDTGEYKEVTNTNTFPEGYILNMDKTGCIDNKGNSVSDILTSKDDKVTVKSNKTVFCYLYFDKDNRVFAQVKRDYKNNTGALLLSETESDEYPVYYYNGKITNNNILYANFCWKMVRTTETGGVKLIYNGVPDKGEDGTLTCDNTGEESQIGTSMFNSSNDSLAYVGYMYNEAYKFLNKGPIYISVFSNHYNPGTFYYGNTAIWDETEGVYKLSNSDGSEVTTYTWVENYGNLSGKYTCRNSYTSCNEVYYVAYSERWWMHYYGISNNTTKDDYKIKLATSVTDNGDGTYTLVDPIEVSKAEWTTVYSNYNNYYYCSDLTSETCSNMYYSISTNTKELIGYNMANVYKYGNSFIYEDGVYKLVDTVEFWDWHNKYNTLNNNHYTCFNTSGECENVHYIYSTDNTEVYYITLSDGKSVENALNEMLYANDVNTTDSTIKDKIDTWYENSIVDELDSNGILYSIYLEDTIWCNNREIIELNGWNPNGGNNTTNSAYSTINFNYNSLECANKTDQFTLKLEAGGTEGYGNNVLDYPIGLLTFKEAQLSSNYSFLYTNNSYWTMSPFRNWKKIVYEGLIYLGGYPREGNTGYTFNVRPSISLSNKVEITSGDGSVSSPYQVELSS